MPATSVVLINEDATETEDEVVGADKNRGACDGGVSLCEVY